MCDVCENILLFFCVNYSYNIAHLGVCHLLSKKKKLSLLPLVKLGFEAAAGELLR